MGQATARCAGGNRPRGRTGGFTLGGLKTDADSRVLHVSGAPIPGLFAAGRCTSGVCAGGYASGTSLGDGSFFGRRAGISAAQEAKSPDGIAMAQAAAAH
ncbi:FAD-binding protein [Glutamicibacter nicotianae]|uniref:FAD-binding protein n=1 Tax=Glutamicibacter nicotianae TaxID=37929 RepID=UPI003B3B7792